MSCVTHSLCETQEVQAAAHQPNVQGNVPGSPDWGMQLPLTTPDQLPFDWHVTRGALLLPAVKYVAHVALQLCPTAAGLAHVKLNAPFAGLAGWPEHTPAAGQGGYSSGSSHTLS